MFFDGVERWRWRLVAPRRQRSSSSLTTFFKNLSALAVMPLITLYP